MINNISSKCPLLLHCAFGDDDLVNQMLYNNGDFNFKFCEACFHNTLFFCHFKYTIFIVSHMCYWSTRRDGIYFSGENPPKN
ncbi:hypothetical protein CDL12_11927 [Handroanthus impetiginosus]|uniref:S-protein homolog n=1 Tax=Handroanthus impetiginosus TaxID=429701 RepID=A0A2G9HD02_9LAMI|nr:hypothetical protein CDL12_11927 [Handroanthus impetiginosus]